MKTLLTATAMLAALAAPTHAYAEDASLPNVIKEGTHTLMHFEKTYWEAVNDAKAQGVGIEVTCWKDFCSNYVHSSYPNGTFVSAFRLVYKNGSEVRQFCVSEKGESDDRNCAASTGGFWREHFSNNTWTTTQVYADHFSDEATGPSA